MRYLLVMLLFVCGVNAHAQVYGAPSANGTTAELINAAVTDTDTYYCTAPAGGVPWFTTFTGNGAPTGAVTTTIGTGLQLTGGVLSCTVTGGSRTFATATPTLNSAARLSTTKDVQVTYPIDVSVTSILLNTTAGTTTLQYADDSGFTTNVVTVCSGTQSVGGVASLTNVGTVTLTGIIPANKYRRIVTANTSGTPVFTARAGQEVTF